jgi:hypothetical protein
MTATARCRCPEFPDLALSSPVPAKPVACACCGTPLELTCAGCGTKPRIDETIIPMRETMAPNRAPKQGNRATDDEIGATKPADREKRRLSFKPKPCAKCGATFTPTGGRDTCCTDCKGVLS